jgi:hypothetical protein
LLLIVWIVCLWLFALFASDCFVNPWFFNIEFNIPSRYKYYVMWIVACSNQNVTKEYWGSEKCLLQTCVVWNICISDVTHLMLWRGNFKFHATGLLSAVIEHIQGPAKKTRQFLS